MLEINWKVNRSYQMLYHDRWHRRFNVFRGGAGSGKSHALYQYCIYDCLLNNYKRWLMIRKTGESLKESVYEGIVKLLSESELYGHVKINKTEKRIEFSNGSTIIMKGIDDPEKIKSIVGVTDCLIEEATELDHVDFKQLRLRLRGDGYKKRFYLLFNPVDEQHWLKQEFFEDYQDFINLVHTTYKDNKFLEQEYIQELESYKDKDEYYYNVYCLGEWGSLNNSQVYTNYKIMDFDKRADTYFQGFDFGYNDPTVWVRCFVRDKNLYICDEYYQDKRLIDEVINDLSKREEYQEVKRTLTIGDSSDPGKIETLRRAGWNIEKADKDKGSIMAGIEYNKKFESIIIHPSCIHTIKEIRAYKFVETKTGIQRDKPLDVNNHAMDAIRYALEPRRKRIAPSNISIRSLGL